MANELELQIALQTHSDNIDIALERREKNGILAVPSILAALRCLPAETQEAIGTLTRSMVLKLLLNQNVTESLTREIEKAFEPRLWKWICEKLKKKSDSIEPPALEHEPLPSLRREVLWLQDNLNPDSPTECMLLAEFYAMNGITDRARELYRMGLDAAARRRDDHPGEVIFE